MSKKLTKKQMKEDRLVTLALQTTTFMQRNFAKVVSGVVVLVAAIGIILFTAHARRNTTAAAEREFSVAMDQFLLGNREQASSSFLNISERYSRQNVGEMSLYFLGECYFALFRFEDALNAYGHYLDAAPDANFAIAAKIGRALCLEGLVRFPEAADAMESIAAELDPGDARYPDALYRTASFYQEAGNRSQALNYYRKLAAVATGTLKDRAEVKISLLE
jgi:tetratricopeptide (TPR) repeat protein